MGDHDDGLAASPRSFWKISATISLLAAIEVAGGLVGQEDGGLVGQGAGDGDALLLAAGEPVGLRLDFVGQADRSSSIGSALQRGRPSRPSLNIGSATFSCAVNSLSR